MLMNDMSFQLLLGSSCQLSNCVAKFSNFSDYPVNFFLRKHLATNVTIFQMYLANFSSF